MAIAAEVLFPLRFEDAGFLLFVNFSAFFIFSMMRFLQSASRLSYLIRQTAMRFDLRLCFPCT
jgi:hypothetical protein